MIPRIDAHQHFWKYNDTDYPWMTDALRILKQDYLPGHLEPSLLENGFHGSVVVQARQIQAETDFLIEMMEGSKMVKAVVGWVDLTAPNLLSILSNYSGRVAGFRHLIHDESDVDFMLGSDFMRGIRMLADFNYTYDLLIRPEHLSNSVKFVDAFPDQPFVIDHLAKPVYTDEGHAAWLSGFTELAERDNVRCKLSGLVTEVEPADYDDEEINIDQFVPFMDTALEAFGADRLMFGSDWPVCTLAATYDEVYDIVDTYIDRLSASEQEAIMGRTAASFYNISI